MTLTRQPDTYVVDAALAGNTAVSAVVGPFNPVEGVPMVLTLTGTWTGSVTVKRSTDAGVTKLALTDKGAAYAVFTANCNEPIAEESEGEARWYLDIVRTTGTIDYRLAQ